MSSPSVPDSSAATDAHTRVDDNATTPVETPTNAAASAEVKSPAAESVTTPGQPAPGNVDPNAQLTVRALVSTKEAGIIIGKGGANVAELRDKTGVKAGVSKVVQGVHDRVLSVTGPLDGISQAYSLIAQTIMENPVNVAEPLSPSGQPAQAVTSIRLLISHNLMGTVIGRQGLKIKHIQDVSGARMVASKDMLPQSTERIVEIQGSVEAIRIAVNEISKCLLEDWERGQGTILYHPGQTEGAGILAAGGAGGLVPPGGRRSSNNMGYLAGAMGGLNLGSNRRTSAAANGGGSSPNAGRRFAPSTNPEAAANAAVTPGGGLNASAAAAVAAAASASSAVPGGLPAVVDAANIRVQNISIPGNMVGCLIGKGGSKITEIRRLSGSRISIAKEAHDETGERMFTIQGTPEANEKALFLLYTQLESEKERRTQTADEEEGAGVTNSAAPVDAAATTDAVDTAAQA